MKKTKLFLISLLSVVSLACLGAVGCKKEDNLPDSSTPPTVEGSATEYTIAFAKSSISLEIFDVQKLNVSVENITETIQYTSSNPAVATVDAAGTVKALSVGNTVITATANGETATCNVSVTDSGFVPTLELNAQNLMLNDDPFIAEAKVKFNGQYMTEGVAITWAVVEGDSVAVTPIENSLHAKLEVTGEGYGATKILVTATFHGKEMSQYVTVGTADGLELGFTSDVEIVDHQYVMEMDVLDAQGEMSAINLAEKLTVELGGSPFTNYEAEYYVDDDNVATVSSAGLVTAVGAGTTTVYTEIDGYVIGLNVTFNTIRVDRTNATPLVLELFDSAEFAATSAYQYNDAYAFSHQFDEFRGGSLKSVKLGDYEVLTGEQAVDTSSVTTVNLNLTNYASADYETEIVFTSDFVSYTYSAVLYTQVLKTTADVQNWLNVAVNLKAKTDGKVTGNFIVGNNITASEYWAYTPKKNSGDFDYNTWKGFEGTFDGAGHYIEKMNIWCTAASGTRVRTAFIPTLAASGVVKNVAFKDAKFTADVNDNAVCGFVTAYCAGTIHDVYVDMTMTTTLASNTVRGFGVVASVAATSANVQRVFVYGKTDVITAADGYEFKMGIQGTLSGGTFDSIFGVGPGYQTTITIATNSLVKATVNELKTALTETPVVTNGSTQVTEGYTLTEGFKINATDSLWVLDANELPVFRSMTVA